MLKHIFKNPCKFIAYSGKRIMDRFLLSQFLICKISYESLGLIIKMDKCPQKA